MADDANESEGTRPLDESHESDSESEVPVGTLIIALGFMAVTAILWFYVYFTVIRRS